MAQHDLTRRDALRLGLASMGAAAATACAASMTGAACALADGTQAGSPAHDAALAGIDAADQPETAQAMTEGVPGSDAPTSGAFGDVDALAGNLEGAGCIVQRGELRLLDTLKMASEGMLVSCFGNNAGSHYLVNFLPPAPNQDPAPAVEQRGWPAEEPSAHYTAGAEGNYPANPYFSPVGWSYKLRADEAVVIAGTMPPACVYFSLINYVLLTAIQPGKDYEGAKGFFQVGNEDIGVYHPVFGSLGMPRNQYGMATEATPGAQPGPVSASEPPASFGSRFVYVMTGDGATLETVMAALEAAGFSESVVNQALLPAQSLNMGLEAGKDAFCTLGRISQPADSAAMDAWLGGLAESMTVLRVTPETPNASPLPASPVTTRGTGVHETAALPRANADLAAIRAALIAQYADEYDYEEPTVDIAVPEGMTAYLNDRNAQGDNHDTTYLMTTDFTLNSSEDFVVVYGVNHARTGKAVYANAVLYARPMLNGVCSVYDGMFAGSATAYLPEGTADVDGYYVYKMARPGWGGADEFTAEIPYSTGNDRGVYYGVDDANPVLAAFRAYIEPATGVGASYYEIVWDRALVFHKRG